MASNVLKSHGVEIARDIGAWYVLSLKYGISASEIGLIDFNRTGVCLDGNEIRIGFRTRFNGDILSKGDPSWYALPVRSPEDSNFHIANDELFFGGTKIGVLDQPVLDTCDTSYQRGPRLLNLNSRSRSNCCGCRACVHNDKTLYDHTVIRDRRELKTQLDIETFFSHRESLGLKTSTLEQIAVVTGLFYDEEDCLNHLEMIHRVVSRLGFTGELMYFGCQLMSQSSLRRFAKLGRTAIVFAIDNFSKRSSRLAPVKSAKTLEDFYAAMSIARTLGIKTTFAYIVGVDSLACLRNGFEYLERACDSFPIVNIFQIQTDLQATALNIEAKNLEYYLKARIAIENIFANGDLRPRRWENYRPLWYREFAGSMLSSSAYG